MPRLPSKTTYRTLVKIIKDEIEQGAMRAEQEKTFAYWRIGKHIHEHLLHFSR